jgi:hypothetical protein
MDCMSCEFHTATHDGFIYDYCCCNHTNEEIQELHYDVCPLCTKNRDIKCPEYKEVKVCYTV